MTPHIGDTAPDFEAETTEGRVPMPALILSALQVNLAGGRLPAPEAEGRPYLKIALNAFPHAPW